MFSAIKSSPSTIVVPHPKVPVPITREAYTKSANILIGHVSTYPSEKVTTSPGGAQFWWRCCSRWAQWAQEPDQREWWDSSSWVRTRAACRCRERHESKCDACCKEGRHLWLPAPSGSRRSRPVPPLAERPPFLLIWVLSKSGKFEVLNS